MVSSPQCKLVALHGRQNAEAKYRGAPSYSHWPSTRWGAKTTRNEIIVSRKKKDDCTHLYTINMPIAQCAMERCIAIRTNPRSHSLWPPITISHTQEILSPMPSVDFLRKYPRPLFFPLYLKNLKTTLIWPQNNPKCDPKTTPNPQKMFFLFESFGLSGAVEKGLEEQGLCL